MSDEQKQIKLLELTTSYEIVMDGVTGSSAEDGEVRGCGGGGEVGGYDA